MIQGASSCTHIPPYVPSLKPLYSLENIEVQCEKHGVIAVGGVLNRSQFPSAEGGGGGVGKEKIEQLLATLTAYLRS